MQEQIKSLEEKNAKLAENNIKMFSDNKKLSSKVRSMKHKMEHFRAMDTGFQLQLHEYSKLLNDARAKNIELENIIKAGIDGETISQQVKAKIGYDLLCTETYSGDAITEPNSDDLKAISEILSTTFTGSAIDSPLSSCCPSCIVDDYLSEYIPKFRGTKMMWEI